MGHAANSPSSLTRRIGCPGSKHAEAPYPDQSSAAAIDGTGSHELLEACITNNNVASVYVGLVISERHPDKPEGWLVAKDRADRVQVVLDYIERRNQQIRREYGIGPQDVQVSSETRSDPGKIFGRDDWNGTADVTITWPQGFEIIDLKDGFGYVNAENNPQTISYGGGFFSPSMRRDDFEVRTTIVQPKTRNPVRFQNFTGATFWPEIVKINDALTLTDPLDAPRIPGDHCQFCKHKSNCVEYTAQAQQGIIKMTDVAGFDQATALFAIPVATLGGAQLAELLDIQPKIMARFKEVTDEATKRAITEPGAIPGYKMAPGKATRVWALPEEEMVKKLKAMKVTIPEFMAEAKLKTPAQMEKLEKFKDAPKKLVNLNKLITTVAGADTLKIASKVEEVSVDEKFADAPESILQPGESIFSEGTGGNPPAAPAAKKPLSFL